MFCYSGKNKFLRGTLSIFLEKAAFSTSIDVTVIDISKLSASIPSSYSSVDNFIYGDRFCFARIEVWTYNQLIPNKCLNETYLADRLSLYVMLVLFS